MMGLCVWIDSAELVYQMRAEMILILIFDTETISFIPYIDREQADMKSDSTSFVFIQNTPVN